MAVERETAPISILSRSMLAERLIKELADAARDLVRAPLSFLRTALLPDRFKSWLPVRLARELGSAAFAFVTHPIRYIADFLSPDLVGQKRWRLFKYLLATSASIHSVFIVYLAYVGLIQPFLGLRVVNKPYRKLDTERILARLTYPPGMFRNRAVKEPMTLEELRELDRKRAEEAARRAKEKAEREKAERERAEKEKAAKEAEQQKDETAEADSDPQSSKFGEINEAPIKAIVGDVYALYKQGGLDLPVMEFTVEAGFNIKRDGSLTNVRLIKSSGSKIIDKKALEILWKIGESHALGPISDLTSNTIRLELTDSITRLTITGFAPTPDIASNKAKMLNFLFWGMRQVQKNSDTAELLSLIKVKSDNKRVDAVLAISRARASEMMRARFNNPNN